MSKYATLTIIKKDGDDDWYVLSKDRDLAIRQVYKATRPFKMTDTDMISAGPTMMLKHEMQREGLDFVQWEMPIIGGASNV